MSSLKTIIVQVTPFVQNASIVYCVETKKCAFIDPGGDIEILLEKAKQENLIPEKILLTHGHIDHAGGANELSKILNLKIEGPHLADKFLLDVTAPTITFVIIALQVYGIKFVREFLEKQAIKKQFAGYASPAVVRLLQENPALIKEGMKRVFTIFYNFFKW